MSNSFSFYALEILIRDVFSAGDVIKLNDIILFSAMSGDKNYDWDSSTLKVVLGGVDITKFLDNVSITASGNTLYAEISGTIVPEPAQIAALLGIVSLFFAARRRIIK